MGLALGGGGKRTALVKTTLTHSAPQMGYWAIGKGAKRKHICVSLRRAVMTEPDHRLHPHECVSGEGRVQLAVEARSAPPHTESDVGQSTEGQGWCE